MRDFDIMIKQEVKEEDKQPSLDYHKKKKNVQKLLGVHGSRVPAVTALLQKVHLHRLPFSYIVSLI